MLWFLWAILIATFAVSSYVLVSFDINIKKQINQNNTPVASQGCKDLMKKHGITTLVIDYEKDETYFMRDGKKIILKTDVCR